MDESQNKTFTLFPDRFGLCIKDKNISEVVHGQHVTKCYIKSVKKGKKIQGAAMAQKFRPQPD